MNFVGALLGQKVAHTVSDVIAPPIGQPRPGHRAGRAARRDRLEPDHVVLRPALVVLARPHRRPGRRGPGGRRASCTGRRSSTRSSSRWSLSPIVGFILRVHRDARDHVDLPAPQPAQGRAAASGWRRRSRPRRMALGHGLQDAQKTMGVIFLALVAGGYASRPTTPCRSGSSSAPRPRSRSAPTPVAGGSCAPSAAGSSTSTRPAGFAAESVGAAVLYTTAYVWEAPISTTHVITSAVMGVGRHQALLRRPLGRGPLDRRSPGCSPSPWPASSPPGATRSCTW